MLLCAMFMIRLFLDKYDKINIFVLDSHCNLMLKATKTDCTNESHIHIKTETILYI